MPKYKIKISQTFSYSRDLEIEAKNEEEARKLAYKEDCDSFKCDDQDYGSGIELESIEKVLSEEDLEIIELNKLIQNNNFFNKLEGK